MNTRQATLIEQQYSRRYLATLSTAELVNLAKVLGNRAALAAALIAARLDSQPDLQATWRNVFADRIRNRAA